MMEGITASSASSASSTQSPARKHHRIPRLGLACCSIILATLAEYCAYLNEGEAGRARRLPHILVFAAFFFILTLLFERFIAWLEGTSEQTTPVEAKLLSAHPEDARNVKDAENASPRQSAAHFWQRILPDFTGGRKSALKATAIMAVCWLPYYVLAFPGAIWYDTVQQVLQWERKPNAITSGAWSDQHPVFDTLIFGLFYQIGAWVGTPAFGVALYTTVITATSIAVLVYVVRYLARAGAGRRVCLLAYGFFCLFPFVPIYAMAMVKDAVFLPCFLLFSVRCMEAARTRGASLATPKAWILISTLALLVSLTKKTGIYTVIIACILTMLAVAGRKARLRLAGTVLASAIIMFLVLPGILFPLCHIEAGGKQEMIAVPLQQSALLLKEHGDELSQADRDVFEGILEPDAANKFFWPAVDPIKGTHWTAQRERLLKPFLRVWLRNGVRYPTTYLRAYFLLEQGWVAMPNQAAYESIYSGMRPAYVYTRASLAPNASDSGLPVSSHALFYSGLDQGFAWLNEQFFLQPWFCRAFWATWLPFMQCYLAVRRLRAHTMSWNQAAWLIPMLATMPFLWISGASVSYEGMRYVIPMVFIAPIGCAMFTVGLENRALRVGD